MADIPLKDRRIQFNAPNANGGNSPAFRANVVEPQPIGQAAHKAGQNVMSTLEVFQKIKRQNDIARATNDLAVYKKKVSDLMNSTEIDPDTGEVKGFLHKKGENAFNSLPQYQDKLSALTKEYQQQIYKYDPDIRDKFTLDSDGVHLEQMNSINSYALNETEKFQKNASEGYFNDLETNYVISSSQQIPLLLEQMYSQVKLADPGQAQKFYDMKVNKHFENVLDHNVRMINEQHSNESSYRSYSYGLSFLEGLYNDKVISKENLQKLGNTQQLRRFDAMVKEFNTSPEDFKKKLFNAKYLDNLEKQKFWHDYQTKNKSLTKADSKLNLERWKIDLFLEPTTNKKILQDILGDGYILTDEEVSALPQNIARLMPYVHTSYKNGTTITYLDNKGIVNDLKDEIRENKYLNNAKVFLDEMLKGNASVGREPLPSLNPEERDQFITFLENQLKNKDANYLIRYKEFNEMQDKVTSYINNRYSATPAEKFIAAKNLIKNAQQNRPDKIEESVKLATQLEAEANKELFMQSYGSSWFTDWLQKAGLALYRWWGSTGPFDTANKPARDVLNATLAVEDVAYANDYTSNIFGNNVHPDKGFRAPLRNIISTMAHNGSISVVVGIQDSKGSKKFVQKELAPFPISEDDVLKATFYARTKFIDIKNQQNPGGEDWNYKYYNTPYSSLSEDDKELQKVLITNEIAQMHPESQLNKIIDDSNSDYLGQRIFKDSDKEPLENKNITFGNGITYSFITDNIEEDEIVKASQKYGYDKAYTIKSGEKRVPLLKIGTNEAYNSEQAIARLTEIAKQSHGKGIAYETRSGVASKERVNNGKTFIKIIVENDSGEKEPMWVTVPEDISVVDYANGINELAGTKISSPIKEFNGKKIVKSDIYDEDESSLQYWNFASTAKIYGGF